MIADNRDGTVTAFTYPCDDAAMEMAATIDARIRTGRAVGPLAGVPVSVKDHIWLAGAPATNGSRAPADFVPARSAVCVERLVAAGAVVVGKTNNPEFCYRGVTSNDLHGVTRNPRTRAAPPEARAAGRPPRWPRGWFPSPSGPTAADRSGSPPPSAAPPGSSRPSG